jgi:hypothetical protein
MNLEKERNMIKRILHNKHILSVEDKIFDFCFLFLTKHKEVFGKN